MYGETYKLQSQQTRIRVNQLLDRGKRHPPPRCLKALHSQNYPTPRRVDYFAILERHLSDLKRWWKRISRYLAADMSATGMIGALVLDTMLVMVSRERSNGNSAKQKASMTLMWIISP